MTRYARLARLIPAPFGPLAVVLIAAGGCSVARTVPLARYERGGEPMTQPAPAGGIYKVK